MILVITQALPGCGMGLLWNSSRHKSCVGEGESAEYHRLGHGIWHLSCKKGDVKQAAGPNGIHMQGGLPACSSHLESMSMMYSKPQIGRPDPWWHTSDCP